MTRFRLTLRSVVYYARAHVGAGLGATLGSAVLIGALAVGDSVRASLRRLADLRLGGTELAMTTGDRLFRATLFGGGNSGAVVVQPGAGQPPGALSGTSVQQGLALVQGAPRGPTRALAWAPALHLPAIAANGDNSARANQVQFYGVDERFWAFSPGTTPPSHLPGRDTVALNEPLARQLKVRVGDEVILRVQKPATLSSDAPLAPEEQRAVARRLKVQAVLRDDQMGRFSLLAQAAAPLNAFAPLAAWAEWVQATNQANLLLMRELGRESNPQVLAPVYTMTTSGPVQVSPLTSGQLAEAALAQYWTLEDIQVRQLTTPGYLELRSGRVFLDPAVADQLQPSLAPDRTPRQPPGPLASEPKRVGVLTYFVNELRVGDRATPYSMVTATAPPLVPPDLGEDEIIINQWLADDLMARPGDELGITYYVVGAMRQFEERAARFRVRAVLPMTAPGLDRSLMPDFPGLSQAQSCRDWDTGLPIQVNRIRDKDEDYWRVYRGTPKALINLAAGQRLWANRFGNLTALRFYPPDQAVRAGSSPSAAGRVANSAPGWAAGARLVDAWKRRTEPATVGLRLRPVRQEASAAVAGSQDFGQLFLGFSFFLVAAALLLMMLLFQLGLEQRATETGLLRALGFKPRQVRRLLLGEAGMIALLGGVLGAWLGPAYARAMLTGLATTWNQAVGGTALVFHAERSTLLYGGLAAAIVTGSTMWWALRRQARQPIHLLLAGAAELEPEAQVLTDSVRGAAPGRRSRAVAVVGAALALALVALPIWRPDTSAAGAFFGAGSLLLLAGLAWCASWLASWPSREGYLPEDLARLGAMNLATRETPDSSGSAQSARRFCRMSPAFPGAGSWDTRRLGTASLALRNATRRRRRSLAVIGLLACGCFLVAAVGVFRQDAVPGAERRASGTGGFALIGAATQPLTRDLNSRTGHQAYGLDTNALAGMSIVPFRVRDGEEASCLNLNRAQQPRLLGVRPDLLDVRGAFTFAQTARDRPRERPWRLLNGSQVAAAESEVPAIGDEASLVWALGKKVGDTIQYTDENGRPFRLRLVAALSNSILQGNLVIAEDEFVKRFPGTSGYRLFLVDAPAGRAEAVSRELTRGLQDFGLELAPTVERLAAFNAVQNTYLGTFQALGGFGLALGSIGLGLVVLRNVLERRGELALLLAVGWSRLAVQRLVLTEHSALLLAGLAVGLAAAALAVLPPLVARHTQVPLGTVGLTLAAVFANGMFWTWAATRLALRGRLLDALRNE